MQREQLIECIKKDITLKREEHIKHYSFKPVKSLLRCISLVILVLMIREFVQYFQPSGYWSILILHTISFISICFAFVFFIAMCIFIAYKFKLSSHGSNVFYIEPYLSKFSEDDLIMLHNQLSQLKIIRYSGEFLCLKDTIIITNDKGTHCFSLYELYAIFFRPGTSSYIEIIVTYQCEKSNNERKIHTIPWNGSADHINACSLVKMKKENDLFNELCDKGAELYYSDHYI